MCALRVVCGYPGGRVEWEGVRCDVALLDPSPKATLLPPVNARKVGVCRVNCIRNGDEAVLKCLSR